MARRLILFFCLLVTVNQAHALSRFGKALSLLKDGVPCFSILDESYFFKNEYQVSALMVEDPSLRTANDRQQSDDVWSFRFGSEENEPRIRDSHCYKYGELPENGIEITAPRALDLNHIYEVFINAEPVGSSITTIGYGGTFCLVKDSQGALSLLTSRKTRDERMALEAACAEHRATRPNDVAAFSEQRDRCDHLRGEVPDSPDFNFVQQVNDACRGTDASLSRLKSKYRKDAAVSAKLGSYEPQIEHRSAPHAQ